MAGDLLALLYTVLMIVAVVAFAFVLHRWAHLPAEATRKLIHIGVSNSVFILTGCFDDLAWAMAGLALFVVVNAAVVYSGAARLLGMGDRKRDNGLIYFPFSILILVLLWDRGLIARHDVIAATLVMGYGDGLAALVGVHFGRHKYSVLNATKSWEGTAVMVLVSLIVYAIFTPYPLWAIAAAAAVAGFFEAVTPLGLDNITVPILTALVGALLC